MSAAKAPTITRVIYKLLQEEFLILLLTIY